jgi:hypothetical protein
MPMPMPVSRKKQEPGEAPSEAEVHAELDQREAEGE